MGSVTAFFTALLSVDFPKVAGVFGLAFLSLGIMERQLIFGAVRIPRRDLIGRITSLVLGFFLVCVALLQFVWNTTVAPINPPTKNSITPADATGNQSILRLFIGTAHAAEKRYTIKISQRSVFDVSSIFGGAKIGLYVGDVHLRRPNVILFFNMLSPESKNINPGAGLIESDIRHALPGADIIFLTTLTQGQEQGFSFGSRRYTLIIESIIWSIVGDDSLTLSVRADVL